MIGIPAVTGSTTAYNSQTLNFYNSNLFDPNYANDPKNAHKLNIATSANEIANIRQLYCSRYKWSSDNPNMPTRFIESMLFMNGMLAFFNDPDFGWLLLPCAVKRFNVYGEPDQVTVTYPYHDKPQKILDKGEFYLFADNPALNIPYLTVQYYTRLIADVARTCEVYVKGMKKPIIISANFTNQQTKKQFVNNILMNESYVLLDESALKDIATNINVLQNSTHNAQDLKGLSMYKTDLYNECVAKLGITTPTVLKQAQVNEDEINKNDTMANIVLNGTYECRQEATKAIYDMAGISLTCEIAADLKDGITDSINKDNTPEE